jgi:diguanylate cyclase (GGDEF)-like protein
LIGRWGGEEFLVAMTQDGATCWRQAEQLRSRIAYLAAPHMTISIGVAERSTQDDSLSQLIHRADMAMYQAKRQGRNQTVLAQSPLSLNWPATLPDAPSCGCQGVSSVSDATFTGAP